jgi:uncharacterized protein YrrD
MKLNHQALQHAKNLIRQGDYIAKTDWSEKQPTARAENTFEDKQGWSEYGKWYLGVDTAKKPDTKEYYHFPYGDFKKVHRSGVIAAKQRAAQNHYSDIEKGADDLLEMMDKQEEKRKPDGLPHSFPCSTERKVTMEFKQDSPVRTSDGQDAGTVSRVVLNPKTKEVSHIVVSKGLLFPEDKVIPLDLIASASEDEVRLQVEASGLGNLPRFEETHYIALTDEEIRSVSYPVNLASPFYWYLPFGDWHDYAPFPPGYRPETRQNIPDDTVSLKAGARAISNNGKTLGTIAEVFTDSATHRAMHLLISHGLLHRETKVIPVSWVRRVTDDEVHLNISEGMFKSLRDYQKA